MRYDQWARIQARRMSRETYRAIRSHVRYMRNRTSNPMLVYSDLIEGFNPIHAAFVMMMES
jgi:hypothetical protein